MHPRISINGISSWNRTLEEDLAFYRSHGIDRIGLMYPKVQEDPQTSAQRIIDAGVDVSCIGASVGQAPPLEAGEGGNATILEGLRPVIDFAQRIACGFVYFPSGPTPALTNCDDAAAALARAIQPALAYAGSRNVVLGVENNSVATRNNGFIHTLADAFQFSRESGMQICVELQNSWYERNFAELVKTDCDRISLVQVSDFKLGEDLKLNRHVLGDGTIPAAWMIEKLLDAGYEGPFDLEILGPSIEKEGYDSAILRSIEWLEDLFARLGV